MIFNCYWINRLDQFDAVDIDLVVENVEGLITPQRIHKNYKITNNYNEVNEKLLEDEAANTCLRLVDEYENPRDPIGLIDPPVPPVLPTP